MKGAPLVLVVDDVEDNREMYSEHLATEDFRVLTAETGDEAVRIARQERPDVVVMDIAMPGMDGIEATRLLRGDDRTRDVAVIMLSGHTTDEHRLRAQEVNADLFLVKPCLPRDLVLAIRTCLRRRC
jgi:CheY-like chemotaxis protein